MIYHVEFEKGAYKTLSKLDKYTAKMLINWIEVKLEGCSDPRIHGKAFISNLSGLWRYRVGDYRIIANIEDETVTILIVAIGHSRDIYN